MTSPLYVSHIALWVAVVVQGLAICALLYKNNVLLKLAVGGTGVRQHALGTLAARFRAIDLRTDLVVSDDQVMGSRTFLLFIAPGCPTCKRLMKDVEFVPANWRESQKLVVYCTGPKRWCVDAYAEELIEADELALLAEHEADVARLFGVRGLPALVELDHTRRIAGYHYPSTWEDVTSLMGRNAVEGAAG